MSGKPRCEECAHFYNQENSVPRCLHPELVHRVAMLPPGVVPTWCPLRGEKALAEQKPEGFTIMCSRDGQIRKLLFGDTDLSAHIVSAEVPLQSDRSAGVATFTIRAFKLVFEDE